MVERYICDGAVGMAVHIDGDWVPYEDHQREVFHLKSQIKKLTEDLEGYKHIAQRDRYYEAFLAWWEGRKD